MIGIDRRPYLAHRLAWLFCYGDWPEGQIDHINRVRSDNRLSNLRIATASENQMNVRGRGPFKKGVTLHETQRFQAQIKRDGRNYYLGLYDTEAEANAAYGGASKVLFGEFRRMS